MAGAYGAAIFIPIRKFWEVLGTWKFWGHGKFWEVLGT